MDRALELGINFFDTAERLRLEDRAKGTTEQIVGRWFAQGGGRREQIVLATKVYGSMGDRPNDRGLSAHHIRKACEDSLRRLQTDHIDLYQMHHVDRDTPWEEIWQAMELLVQQGKVTLRRQQQLRRLAHRQSQAHAANSATSWAWSRSRASTTSTRARSSSKCFPACRALRPRRDPLEPARRRPARRRASTSSGTGRRARPGDREARIEKHRPQLEA